MAGARHVMCKLTARHAVCESALSVSKLINFLVPCEVRTQPQNTAERGAYITGCFLFARTEHSSVII